MNLRFNFLPAPVVAHELRIDLSVEVSDVTNDRVARNRCQQILIAHIDVAGAGHNHIGALHQS